MLAVPELVRDVVLAVAVELGRVAVLDLDEVMDTKPRFFIFGQLVGRIMGTPT